MGEGKGGSVGGAPYAPCSSVWRGSWMKTLFLTMQTRPTPTLTPTLTQASGRSQCNHVGLHTASSHAGNLDCHGPQCTFIPIHPGLTRTRPLPHPSCCDDTLKEMERTRSRGRAREGVHDGGGWWCGGERSRTVATTTILQPSPSRAHPPHTWNSYMHVPRPLSTMPPSLTRSAPLHCVLTNPTYRQTQEKTTSRARSAGQGRRGRDQVVPPRDLPCRRRGRAAVPVPGILRDDLRGRLQQPVGHVGIHKE